MSLGDIKSHGVVTATLTIPMQAELCLHLGFRPQGCGARDRQVGNATPGPVVEAGSWELGWDVLTLSTWTPGAAHGG